MRKRVGGAVLILLAAALVSLVFVLWTSWRDASGTENEEVEYAIALLAADARRAALIENEGAGLYVGTFRLDSSRDGEISHEELNALRAKAVGAIESFQETSQSEDGRLWFDASTSQLTIIDTAENVMRMGRFLESLGFPVRIVTTPTSTPTPGLRPIS